MLMLPAPQRKSMFLFRALPAHLLLIGAGLVLTPTPSAWAQAQAQDQDQAKEQDQETTSPAEAPGLAGETPTPQLKDAPEARESEEKPAWDFEFSGYLRTKFSVVQNDPNYQLIGRRDGFSMANIWLGFRGSLDNGLGVDVTLDGAAALPKGAGDDASVEMGARFQDAFIYYAPHKLLRVSAGQFIAPFDIETLTSSARLTFVDRSVGNTGVSGLDGLPVSGLGQGRQVGLRVDSDIYYFLNDSADAAPSGPGVSYSLAVTNGQPNTLKYNDNEKLAYFGRLNLHWGDLVRLGGAGFHNERTLGVAPDRLGEKSVGWTGDLSVSAYGFSLLANIMQVEITPAPELQAEQARTARSMQAEIAYEEPFFGLQPAYRIAYYDANIDGDAPGSAAYEALTYHTVGLNYNSPDYPVRLMLNYTVTGEEQRPIDNNRFDALAQVQW